MVKIWSEWNVARLVLPVSAIVVLFWTAGLWTGLSDNLEQLRLPVNILNICQSLQHL